MPINFIPCAQCGKTFRAHSSRETARFCSYACRSAYPAIKRLYERVDFNGPTVTPELGPCWDFPFALSNGYGTLADDSKKVVKAHRLAYKDAYGDEALPDDLLLRHKCDRPLCIRPEHGEPGTHHDNMQDAVSRGRKPRTDGTFLSGDQHRRSKLTDAQALEAYQLRADGWELADIAKRYSVDREVIGSLCRGERRKHLKLQPIQRDRWGN